ncbi:DNA/RNA helicase domain-containing protein [Fervidibacillus halotolerans]|uniref:DUF2075 domain-containing protein n=1 Tax=Fervidibacillus halotolerans TaxID=2980027 RepID=A0A9E8LY35_9BACI|nr:DNA/RNA helicase domain-containing protein [Fervidibacillus halotolerans]WAA11873.1 DUF2075 domain-containing protein [Fervidibacillus halotolerans]
MSNGHYKLKNEYGWKIYSIKDFVKNFINNDTEKINSIDFIIFDEAQRTYSNQMEKILSVLQDKSAKCIFSYDPNQFLGEYENKGKIEKWIDSIGDQYKIYHLKGKIRTNKELSAFVQNLFDKNKINPNIEYKNFYLQYFTKAKDVKMFCDVLKNNGWQVLNYTSSIYNVLPYDSYQSDYDFNAHEVIGQEFDNVAVVINNYFFYKIVRLIQQDPQDHLNINSIRCYFKI